MAWKKKILLVDDEQEVVEALKKFFAQKGYQVSIASDGSQAIGRLKEGYDLLILDMHMPNVDGIGVLEHIKKGQKPIKTIVLTGFGDEYREKVKRLGAGAFFTKPFSIERLLEAADLILKGEEPVLEKDGGDFADDEYIAAKAKVLVYSPNSLVYGNIAAHLRQVHLSGGFYTVEPAYGHDEFLGKINSFKPDIVFVDASYFSIFEDLAGRIFKQKHQPKDLIIFASQGDASLKQPSELNVKTIKGLFDPISTAFNRNYILRFLAALRQACLQHGLCQRLDRRWDIDYQKQKEQEQRRMEIDAELARRRSDFSGMPEAVNQILVRRAGRNQWHLKPNEKLDNLYKQDLFLKTSALVDVEEYYGVKMTDTQIEKIYTVRDVYSYIAQTVFGKKSRKKW